MVACKILRWCHYLITIRRSSLYDTVHTIPFTLSMIVLKIVLSDFVDISRILYSVKQHCCHMSIFILTPASVREQYDMFLARTVCVRRKSQRPVADHCFTDFTGSMICYAFVPKITIAFSGSQVIDSEIVAPQATAVKKFCQG